METVLKARTPYVLINSISQTTITPKRENTTMKFLSIFLVFILLLSSTVNAQEKKNPLAGTTWKLISGKWATEDTTVTFPNSPYHQQILIYGKTHFNLVSQDTSRDYSFSCSATYTIDGDNYTATYNMFSN